MNLCDLTRLAENVSTVKAITQGCGYVNVQEVQEQVVTVTVYQLLNEKLCLMELWLL